MAYNPDNPADKEFIAAGPAVIRDNFRALLEDEIVNAGALKGLHPGNEAGKIPVSNTEVCKGLNAEMLGGLYAGDFSLEGHSHITANQDEKGFMSNTDWQKLRGIQEGAQVNQNAFAQIKVGTTEIIADNPSDTLEIMAGNGIGLTPDAASDRLTINITSISDSQISNRTIDQNATPSVSTGLITDFLSWLANRIRAITGKTNWYDAPATTIEELHNGKVSKSGDTMDGGTDTKLTLLSDDAGESVIEIRGTTQGTGRLLVGKSTSFGGGIEYSGDDKSTTSGAGPDYVTLYKKSNGIMDWTARNHHDSNVWEFRETPKVGENNIWHAGNDGPGSNLDADLLDGHHISNLWGELDGIRTKDILFQPADVGGNVGIEFTSKTKSTDKGYVRWYDNNDAYAYWGSGSNNNGAFIIGVTGDAVDQNNAADVLVLKSPTAVVVDAPELRGVTGCKVKNAVYNDYAEYFLKDEELEPGDVVAKNPSGEGYIKATTKTKKLVVGVVSDNFAYCIGGDGGVTNEQQEAKYAPIGLAGKVEVKVMGEVNPGDLLTSSDLPGVAVKVQDYLPGTVIGKALGSHKGRGVDRIQMLVMNS